MSKILNSKYFLLYFFTFSVVVSLLAGYLIITFLPFNTHDGDLIGEIAVIFSEKFSFEGSVRRAPLYPFLLGLLYIIFGQYSSFALIFLHSLFIGLTSVAIYKISLELYSSKSRALFISIFSTLNPIMLWYVPRYYVVIIFTFFLILVIWYAYKSFSTKKIIYPVLFGIFTGIACLIKAVLLLFPLFLGISLLLLYLFRIKLNILEELSVKSIIKITFISTFVMALTISPWTIRNKIVSGKYIIVSSNSGVEFFRGNSYALDNSYLINGGLGGTLFENAIKREDQMIKEYGIEDFERINHIDADLDSIFNPLMKEYIVKTPGKFAVKTLKQIPPFWYLGRDNKFSIFRLFVAIILITLFLFVVRKEPLDFYFIVIITIVYLNLIYAATIATARYSIPLYPIMFIPVGFLVYNLLERYLSRYKKG